MTPASVMRWAIAPAWLVAAALLSRPGAAHVVAGARVFPVTLTFDDPGVSDEVSVPALSYAPVAGGDGSGAGHDVDLGFEFDKTITDNTALILNDGYNINQTSGAKTQTGWQNLVVTGKFQAYTNADHEFVVSLGVIREIGGTGTIHTGGDAFGSTAPTGYFGKGFGDLPIGAWQPIAITGELGYSIADKQLKVQAPPAIGATSPVGGGIATLFNNGNNNEWAGALSLQYSIPYLQSQVRDIGLHGWLGQLIPLVEFTWTSPASSPANQATSWTAAPGVIYLAPWGEIGLEAMVPMDRGAGSGVGAVALVHVFLDGAGALGKPLIP